MNLLSKLSTAIVCAIPVIAMGAGQVIDTQITRVHMYQNPQPNGGVFVQYDKPKSGGCDSHAGEFFIDLNSKKGELQYAHIISAFHAKANVSLYGTGNCELHGAETLADIQVHR